MIDYTIGVIADIEKELKVIQAIWDGRITFGNDSEGDIVCYIGKYWFYFYVGDLYANQITPDNIKNNISIMELAEMIRNAIEDLGNDEGNYCCDILGW